MKVQPNLCILFSLNDSSDLSETNGFFAAGLEGLSEAVIKRKRCQILKGNEFQRLRGEKSIKSEPREWWCGHMIFSQSSSKGPAR